MSVKVSLSTTLMDVKDFPKLMINENRTIVLFGEKDKGVVLEVKEAIYSIGDYHYDWVMSYFKDYNGEITLKNE